MHQDEQVIEQLVVARLCRLQAQLVAHDAGIRLFPGRHVGVEGGDGLLARHEGQERLRQRAHVPLPDGGLLVVGVAALGIGMIGNEAALERLHEGVGTVVDA